MIATIIAPYCAVLNINSGWNAQNKAFSGYFEPEKGPFLHLGSRYWKGKPTFCEQYHNLYIKLLHGTKKILNRWISIFFQKRATLCHFLLISGSPSFRKFRAPFQIKSAYQYWLVYQFWDLYHLCHNIFSLPLDYGATTYFGGRLEVFEASRTTTSH